MEISGGAAGPFGTDLLFDAADVPGLTVGVEICEDMFGLVPPSSGLALAGATVLLNLSGSLITIGRADTRSVLCRTQSMRCLSAYLYAAAGRGSRPPTCPGTARPASSRTAGSSARAPASRRSRS